MVYVYLLGPVEVLMTKGSSNNNLMEVVTSFYLDCIIVCRLCYLSIINTVTLMFLVQSSDHTTKSFWSFSVLNRKKKNYDTSTGPAKSPMI
jgi:hypothetical protein